MPETFPTYDEATRTLRDVEYFSLAELADMLHMSTSWAYTRAKREGWPCFKPTPTRRFFSAEDVGVILASMRENDAPDIPEDDGGPLLGIAVPPDPWLRDEHVDDVDPGGVR